MFVAGYYSRGDLGGGWYRYDSADNSTPNDGSIIIPDEKVAGINGGTTFLAGRWRLIHNGVVTIRQFGAVGDNSATTLASQWSAGRWPTEDYVRLMYSGLPGEPFSGLRGIDTADWAAIQAAINWCQLEGVRLQVPSGEYKVRRGLWIGSDRSDTLSKIGGDESFVGFMLEGQTSLSREQADFQSASIRLSGQITNRFCLSWPKSSVSSVVLKFHFGDAVVSVDVDKTDSATTIVSDITSAGLPDGVTVATDLDDPSKSVGDQNVYLNFTKDAGPDEDKTLFVLAEVLDSGETVYQEGVYCYVDSGVLSMRQTASIHNHVSNLTLKGNDVTVNADNPLTTPRNASFGIVHVMSAFDGTTFDNIVVTDCDIAYGLLRYGAYNGEGTRFTRLRGYNSRIGFYSNAPQAYLHQFQDWWLGLANDGYFMYLDRVRTAVAGNDDNGYTLLMSNGNATFGDGGNSDGKGTLLKAERGNGSVTWIGGRIEHMARLFEYEATDADKNRAAQQSLDFRVQGLDCEAVFGQTSYPFVDGNGTEQYGTQFGLLVDGCRFRTSFQEGVGNDKRVLTLSSVPQDNLRCVFTECRFEGVQGIESQGGRAEFMRCYRGDFNGSGSGILRAVETTLGTPGQRTQSTRKVVQDTPFVQSGPRFNVLRASDFALQDDESSSETTLVAINTAGTYPWKLTGGATSGHFVFAKWCKFTEANVDMSPAAFYLALQGDQSIHNDIDVFDLSTVDKAKVATYQALVRVKGKVRFALVQSNATTTVFDEVVVESLKDGMGNYTFTDLTQVTLRGQFSGDATGANYRLLIKNLLTGTGTDKYSALKVTTQQAWAGKDGDSGYPLPDGLANASFAFTPDGAAQKNTYLWSVNALGVRAQSRFVLPAKPQRYGWEQRSLIGTTNGDLRDGDAYYDTTQKAVLMVMNQDQFFCVHQPDRTVSKAADFTWNPGDAKNVVVENTSSAVIVSLNKDTGLVPEGTVVRVYHATTATNTVAVRFGTTGLPSATITSGKSSEFVFVGGKWRSTYHDVTYVQQ